LLSTSADVSSDNAEASEVGRSAIRKATWRLIPLIAFGYGAAYMDRVNISFAQAQMSHELHFSSTVYGFGAGLFFVSYSVLEIPSNMLLYRVGARRWLARIMLTWGLLAMAMMLVRNPIQFYVMRFLLGMAEAGFFPGVLFYLTQWFPANIRARTISRFYVSLPLSSVVMGALAGGLFKLDGRMHLSGWQWLFLVEGIPPVLLSIIFLKFLPDSPNSASWLSEGERVWIQQRLAAEGTDTPGGHATGIGSALLDFRVWLFCLVNLLMLGTSYAYGFYAPTLIQRLTSLDVTQVGFIISGMGLLGAAGMLLNAWLSDRSRESYFHILVPCLLESGCFVVIAATMNPYIAVPAIAIMLFSQNAMQGPLLALPTTFLKGEGAAAGLATINMVGILGGAIGPYAMGWARDFTGSYQKGLGVLSVVMLTAGGVVLALRSIAKRQSLERTADVHP
jgi:ACS family tartrate transporter-like MFS transporter